MTSARIFMRTVLLTSMFTTIKQSLMAKISAAAKTILPSDHENTTVEIRMEIYRNGPAAFNVRLDRQYVRSVNVIETWNREAPKSTTAEQLRNAMMRIPGMRTFFANGYYDGAAEIGIVYNTVSHAGLPKDRVFVKGYPSGHMIYFGEDNIEELCNDIRSFVEGNDPTK